MAEGRITVEVTLEAKTSEALHRIADLAGVTIDQVIAVIMSIDEYRRHETAQEQEPTP